MRGVLLGLGLGAVLALATARPAAAIPAFARKYNTGCATCHVTGPAKRNPFGEAFELNGYRLPGDAEVEQRREPEIQLGNPARAGLFPRSTYPGELPAAVPLSIISQSGVGFGTTRGDRLDFDTPLLLRLAIGGTLGANLAFFGQHDLVRPDDASRAVGPLKLVIADPLGDRLPDGMLSLRVGRFVPGPAEDGGVRALSGLAVALDGFTLRGLVGGVEAYGRPGGRVLWRVGAVTGEGALDDPSDGKDVYASVDVKLGGLPYLVTGATAESSSPWRERSVRFGLAAYRGEHQLIRPDDPMAPGFENVFWRAVARARGTLGDLDLSLTATFGRDDDAVGDGRARASLGLVGQLDYVFLPWLQGRVRYEERRVEEPEGEDRRAREVGPSITAFARMNLAVTLTTALTFVHRVDDPTPGANLFVAYAF